MKKSENHDFQSTHTHFNNKFGSPSNNTRYNDMSDFSDLRTQTINQVISHVFRRPYLAVTPETPFLQFGTYLATGYQVFVDGLIVAIDKKLVGRISGKHILKHILNTRYNGWSSVTASNLMDSDTSSVEIDSSLSRVFELFARTRFALAPVTSKGSLVGSIGIRDLLPLISELNLDATVTTIGSPIVRVSKNETLKNTIEIMLKNNIRNLVTSAYDDINHEENYVVNDRRILEFIFSYEGRKIVDHFGAAALNSVNISSLDTVRVPAISDKQTISEAAIMLQDINTPALLLNNAIVTPWDAVMKTMGKENLSYD